MNTIQGKIQVFNKTINAWVDDEIARYYRSLVPLSHGLKPTRAPAHISVTRPFEGVQFGSYKRFQNATIEIWYEPFIFYNETYYWLNAWSIDIEEIRSALYLPKYLGDYSSYHITIGNLK